MGGTYFITVMDCIEKLCIYKTKLLLKSQVDVFNYAVDIGHECSMCGYLLDEKASEVFDNLEHLEKRIPDESNSEAS